MLNTIFDGKTGLLTLTDLDGKKFAQIEWVLGLGFIVSINPGAGGAAWHPCPTSPCFT